MIKKDLDVDAGGVRGHCDGIVAYEAQRGCEREGSEQSRERDLETVLKRESARARECRERHIQYHEQA